MKELQDNTQVPSGIYYYLLDWNEKNRWDYMQRNFEKMRLCDLNLREFKQLFLFATSEDYKNL